MRAQLAEHGVLFLSTPHQHVGSAGLELGTWTKLPEANPQAKYVDGHIYEYNIPEVVDVLRRAGYFVDCAYKFEVPDSGDWAHIVARARKTAPADNVRLCDKPIQNEAKAISAHTCKCEF
jgi:hypothetical protein